MSAHHQRLIFILFEVAISDDECLISKHELHVDILRFVLVQIEPFGFFLAGEDTVLVGVNTGRFDEALLFDLAKGKVQKGLLKGGRNSVMLEAHV